MNKNMNPNGEDAESISMSPKRDNNGESLSMSTKGEDAETLRRGLKVEGAESLSMSPMEKMLNLRQRFEKVNSQVQASGPSPSILAEIKNICQEFQQIVNTRTVNKAQDPSEAKSQIRDELDKTFAVEEVGHSCDLCQRDLAMDPERLGGSLTSLQEACVLACSHVYHFKCLRGTTLDLDNKSTDPSCIFCISSSN